MNLAMLLKNLAPFVPLGSTYLGGRQAQAASRASAVESQRATQEAYRQQMAILAQQRQQAEAQMAQLQAQFEVEQANIAAAREEQARMNQATMGLSQERLAMEKQVMADAMAERERKRASAAPFREATLAYLAKPVEQFRPSIGLYKRS